MRDDVKPLDLVHIRVCGRCCRGGAEFRTADGDKVAVPLDAIRTRQLSEADDARDVRSFTEVVLEALATAKIAVSEVVLDLSDGRLGALVSLAGPEEPEVVRCSADEAVALALRGGVRVYATDEALAHAGNGSGKPAPTVH